MKNGADVWLTRIGRRALRVGLGLGMVVVGFVGVFGRFSGLGLRRVASVQMGPGRRISGVVFDLDGCLTVQGAIDFVEMRRRAKIPPRANILEHIDGLPEADRARAMSAVMEVEAEGIERMKPREDLHELFELLDREDLKRALLTRNTHHAIVKFKEMSGKYFHEALDRSFLPPKPSPAPLLEICSRWNLPPEEVIMVGDHR